MRVLHVAHRYPPAIGGAEVWLREVALRLATTHGHDGEVHVLAVHDEVEYVRRLAATERTGAYGVEDRDGPLRIVRHPVSVPPPGWSSVAKRVHRVSGRYLWGPHSRAMNRALPDAIRGCDLVHVHTHPYPHVPRGIALARRLGKPVVVTPHFHPGMALHLGAHSLRALAAADRVFTVSEHESEALAHHGVARERLVRTGNGVDLARLRALAARTSTLLPEREPGVRRVVFLGRKVDYKGVDVLIEALRRLREARGQALELVLIGPTSAWFERTLAALSPEQRAPIRDLGVLDEADKVAALAACDLLVQPSPHEAFGIVFLEAWACGLPVVGADAGAIPGVVERGGLVFRPGDADDLARAVARLLDEPELARAAARRGLERVEEEFDWDRIAATVDACYRELRPHPRRVLVVSALYPPRSHGGAEVMARAGAVGLAARGWEVRVLGTYRDPTVPAWRGHVFDDAGTQVHYHPIGDADNTPGHLRHQRAPEAEQAFSELIEAWRPDVVHFHNVQSLSHRLIDLAEDAGLPTAMTLHDYWPLCFKHTRMLDEGRECDGNGVACLGCLRALVDAPEVGVLERNAAVRSSFDRLRLMLAPARYLAARYEGDGVDGSRLRLHPYGIDLARFRPVAEARVARTPLRVGFVGYVGRHKGVLVLAEAARALSGAFELVVFGGGAEEGELAARLAPLGQRARLRGPIPHARVHEAFAEVDVLVLPSLWPDNFPVSILEALASGVPVVASRAGGMPEQIREGVDGHLVPQGDVEALRACLQALIDEPARVARMSQAAREGAEAWDLARYLERLEGHLAEACRLPPRAARTRPLVVHAGRHDGEAARALYDALARLSAAGLEIEPLAARHADDSELARACAAVLGAGADDAVELALRAHAAGTTVLVDGGDARAVALGAAARRVARYADALELAAQLRVLASGAAAPAEQPGADAWVRERLGT